MEGTRNLRVEALRLFGLNATTRPSDPAGELAYDEYQREVGLRIWIFVVASVALFALLWWPADAFLLRGQPAARHALSVARGVSIGLSVVALWLLVQVKSLRRSGTTLLAVLACVNLLLWSFEMGEVGDPGTPWFNFLPQLVFGAMVVSVPTRGRVIICFALAASLAAGYFGAHPQYLRHPLALTELSSLGGTVFGAVAVGSVVEYLRREGFFLKRATEHQAEVLAGLNTGLEERVLEQTAELRALTQRLETARESERTRIARELHDELGQELTALRLALRFTRVRYERDGAEIRGNLDELEALLARTTATSRNILLDLRPRVLDDLGLPAAAEWLAERTRQRSGVECRLHLPKDELHLSDDLATTAFRIIQEALTNVVRHAHATRADITVNAVPDAMELVIEDDGVGFEDSKRRATGGLGLVGMRERVRAAGGELGIQTRPGGGTTIRVRLPLPPQAVVESA